MRSNSGLGTLEFWISLICENLFRKEGREAPEIRSSRCEQGSRREPAEIGTRFPRAFREKLAVAPASQNLFFWSSGYGSRQTKDFYAAKGVTDLAGMVMSVTSR